MARLLFFVSILAAGFTAYHYSMDPMARAQLRERTGVTKPSVQLPSRRASGAIGGAVIDRTQ